MRTRFLFKPGFTQCARKLIAVFLAVLLTQQLPAVRAAEGDLDPSFGSSGRVITEILGGDEANAIAIQSDGKIVAAGLAFSFDTGTSNDFALTRYDPNGTLDTGFGVNGKVVTDFLGGSDVINAVAIQNDGKILAAGVSTDSAFNSDFALARYNSDGTLDSAFGLGGKVRTHFFGSSDTGKAMAVQSDGKIVVAGFAIEPVNGFVFAVARYNPDGTLDTSFGSGGKTFFPAGSHFGTSVAIQADGKIVIGGFVIHTQPDFDFALARHNSDGTVDTTFGTNGSVMTDFSGGVDEVNGILIQNDGKIVASGFAGGATTGSDLAVARYNSDGSLDGSFGSGGKVTTDFFGFEDNARAVVLQPGGKILLAGSVQKSSDVFDRDFALVRYNNIGAIDNTFGVNGRVLTDFTGTLDEAHAVAIEADGQVVAAGRTFTQPGGFALARYLGAAADLVLTKVATPVQVDPGQEITYTISVTNQGPDETENVNLSEQVPAGTTFRAISATGFTCSTPAIGGTGAISCTIPLMEVNQTATVSIRVAADTTLSETTIINTATVTSATPDPNSSNNTASTSTRVSVFDVCIQDDTTRSTLKINTTTGAYSFKDCLKGFELTGRGVISTNFCKVSLTDLGPDPRRPDRNVSAIVNPCTNKGSATIQSLLAGVTFTISDANIRNNSCSCR